MKIVINKIDRYFQKEFELCDKDCIKLRYALEIILNDCSKLILLFLTFSLLDTSVNFLYCFLTLSLLRPFTGGLHFKTYIGCILFSGAFFYLSIFLADAIPLDFSSTVILLLLSGVTMLLLAPIPAKTRPVHPPGKILKFKCFSMVIISFHFFMWFLTNKHPYFMHSIWVIGLQSIQLFIGKGVLIYEKQNSNLEKNNGHVV